MLAKVSSLADTDIAFHYCTDNLLARLSSTAAKNDCKNLYIIYGNICQCGISLRQAVLLCLNEDYFNRISSDLADELDGEFGLWSLVQAISFELSEEPSEFIFD